MSDTTIRKEAISRLKAILQSKITLAEYLIKKRFTASIDEYAFALIQGIKKSLIAEYNDVQLQEKLAAIEQQSKTSAERLPVHGRDEDITSELLPTLIRDQQAALGPIQLSSQPEELTLFFALVSAELGELLRLGAITQDTISAANRVFQDLETIQINIPRVPLPKRSASMPSLKNR